MSYPYYKPDDVRVQSLSTLSTPHQGSVGADLSVAKRTLNDATSQDADLKEFLNKDWWVDASGKGPEIPGLLDLQTSSMATFNAANPFPSSVRLYTYGADADLNDDGQISLAEATPLIPNKWYIDEAEVGTVLYRVLRDVSSITATRMTNLWGFNEWHEITPNATASPQQNDLVVTDTSSQHSSQIAHFGPLNRNHANINDAVTMQSVLNRIQADFPIN